MGERLFPPLLTPPKFILHQDFRNATEHLTSTLIGGNIQEQALKQSISDGEEGVTRGKGGTLI